jgi:hypothetical protein
MTSSQQLADIPSFIPQIVTFLQHRAPHKPDENGRLVDVDKASLEGVDEPLCRFVRAGDCRRAVEADERARNCDLLARDYLQRSHL